MQRIVIGPEEAGCRVDRLLRKRLTLLPLSAIYSLIRKGGVHVGGKRVRQDYRLREGDVIDIEIDAAEVAAPHAPDVSLVQLAGTSAASTSISITSPSRRR